jgi:hypothetical protein
MEYLIVEATGIETEYVFILLEIQGSLSNNWN